MPSTCCSVLSWPSVTQRWQLLTLGPSSRLLMAQLLPTRPSIVVFLEYLALNPIWHLQFASVPLHAWSSQQLLIKRILRNLMGTISPRLDIGTESTLSLIAYSDTDWDGCLDSKSSTSSYCIYLGDNLVSWSSKQQTTVSCSSAEVEYCAVALWPSVIGFANCFRSSMSRSPQRLSSTVTMLAPLHDS